MKTLQFNTNIKCEGCKAQVAPFLDKNEKIKEWDVDINRSDKLLTVMTELSQDDVIRVVTDAGFKAESI